MRLGLNTNVYIDHELDDVIQRVALMGYEGVDVARTHLCERYRKVTRDDIIRAREASKKYGIAIYNIQGSWGPFLDVEFAKKRIELARELECPLVNLGAGLPYGPHDDHDSVLRNTISLLGELRDYAKSYGIGVAVEPEVRPHLSPQTPAIHYYRLFDVVVKELPDVGLVLDVEHAVVNHENPIYVARKYKNHIKVMHLSDTFGGLHLHLVPGHGEIDFFLLFKELKEMGYEGFISVEIYPYHKNPDAAAYASITYIQKVLSEIGGHI